MIFTGPNLLMVRTGIALALAELHNQIATCPNVFEFADAIDELEQQKRDYENLLDRIDVALAKEVVG